MKKVMLKKWNDFILEFIESPNYIDTKMQEIKDIVENFTDGNNILYEWENKNDHQLVVSFSNDELSIKYEFNIDDLYLIKTANDKIDFEKNVNSIDEAMDIIEKDIHFILGVDESKKWIQTVIKNAGALRDSLKKKKGEKITKKEIDDSIKKLKQKDKDKEKQGIQGLSKKDLKKYRQLNLAKTLKSFK